METMQIERFDEMPDGWCIDNTWGSPEHLYTPICNGKSILNGGRKGLLRVRPVTQTEETSEKVAFPAKKQSPKLSKDEVKATSETMNVLARSKFKEKLLQELMCDLMVCRIEGWDCKEYVTELKQLIDETYQKMYVNA